VSAARTLSLAALGASLACAPRPRAAPQPAPDAARCGAINDSLIAVTNLGELPQGSFRDSSGYRSPGLPSDMRKGDMVLVRYVARPDGTAEPETLVIAGTADEGFRDRALEGIARLRLVPARIEGCPVRSRVDLYLTKS
jgi:hypothetical protein